MTRGEDEDLREQIELLRAENARLRARLAEAGDRRLRAIFESAVDFAIVATDPDGRVTDWNPGAERVLGWSAEAMRGQPLERIFTPEDRAAGQEAEEMRLARACGRASDERWHLRADGTRFWASGEMMPLRAPDGAALGFLKILRDRTEQHLSGQSLRETEARLRESEDHFRHTVELNPQVPWTCDAQGSITSYSNRWLELTGQAPGEPLGAGWAGALHPDDVPGTMAAFGACLASGEPVDVDYRIHVAAVGDYRWMRARAFPRRDAEGAIVRWYGVVEDIHDRRRAEDALRESESRYRTLFETIEVGFCIVRMRFDAGGRAVDYLIEEANPAFARQTGADVVGRWVSEFAPDLERHWFDTYGRVALTGEAARFEDYAAVFRRWFDVRALRVGDPGQRRVAIFFNDVTARRRAETHLASLVRLSDGLRDLAAPADIAFAACEVLGDTLAVELAGYGEVDPAAETVTIERDWFTGRAGSFQGTVRLRDYGAYVDDLKRGETVVVADAARDPRTRAQAATLRARGVGAFVNVPVFEHGRLVALLYVSQGGSREWHEDELAFVQAVAERTRSAVERARAEAAVRAGADELRLVADAFPVLVAFVDRGLTYRYANAAYREWFDRDPRDVVGRPVIEIVGEAGLEARRAMIDRALAGETVRADLDWPWSDGRRRIADIRYTPRRDARGAVDGFYVFAQDVTAQRDAAALLAERADTLARQVAERTADRNALWQLSRDLMLRCTFDGAITAVNPAWTEMLGWREHELLGRSLFDLIHPDDLAHTVEGARQLAEGTAHGRFDNRYRHRDGGYRWITWSTRPGDGLINAVGRDFTAEKEQAEALARTEEALRQSQKIEAIGQLTGGVAHDFNNLLTIIRSSVDFLRRPNLPEERRARYMDAVSDTVDRAAKLTGQLLAFARRQALKPETFDVGARLQGVADMLDTVTGARIRVVTEVPARPCFVRCDLSQFETALVNMAVNARDAMEGAGTLTLRLACDERMPAIRGHAPSREAFAAVSVSDTGSGIAPADLARIFEPFFTTKGVGQGTGLGLSQVIGFAKQSGGDVDVDSALGRGTTFTLYLPQAAAAAEDGRPARPAEDATDGAGRRVLVVEDNVEVGRFATQILEDLGYETALAANAEEALARLGGDGAGFDAVFSDVVMPGVNGVELAREVGRRLPGMPVVLASGYSHVLAEEGAHGFELLHKPYSAEQLSRVLRRTIGGWAGRPCPATA